MAKGIGVGVAQNEIILSERREIDQYKKILCAYMFLGKYAFYVCCVVGLLHFSPTESLSLSLSNSFILFFFFHYFASFFSISTRL
jgi:hypothetical protein